MPDGSNGFVLPLMIHENMAFRTVACFYVKAAASAVKVVFTFFGEIVDVFVVDKV